MSADLPALALSIRQPWAWAILSAGKDIENRKWSTAYRGPVCLHASAYKPNQGDVDDFNAAFAGAVPDEAERSKLCPRHSYALDFDRGGIVGTAEIVDCVETSDSPWFFGLFGFVLANPRPVPFLPVKGALGLFDWRKRIAHPTSPSQSDMFAEIRP